MTQNTRITLACDVVVGDTIIAGTPINPDTLTVERIETDGKFIRFNGMVDFRADAPVTVQALPYTIERIEPALPHLAPSFVGRCWCGYLTGRYANPDSAAAHIRRCGHWGTEHEDWN